MFITKKTIKTLTLISSLFIVIGCNSNVTSEAEIPVITSISSDSTTTVNNSVTLNIEAMVTDEGQITFQWYSATQEKLKEGIPIEDETTGANTKDFTPDVSTPGTFYYYCVITNTLITSSSSIISPRISVTVNEKQSIGKQEIITMPKNFSGEIGDSFNFEVITSSKEGVTKQFQWYYSETEKGDFTAIKDAIKNEYRGKIETSNLGFYYCVITYSITYDDDETQTESLTTNIVQLSDNVINANYPTIIIQPDDATAVMPQTKTFKVKALSPDSETYDGTLSYQWYTISEDGKESSIIEDATTDTLNVTVSRLHVGKTIEYYCLVTNTITDNGDGGEKSKSVSSNTAKLSVEIVNAKTPIIDSNPVDIRTIIPAAGTFTVGATATDGGTLTYQWYKAGNADDDTLIEGATNKTFTVSINEKSSTNYYCMITNTITDNGDGGIKTASIKSTTANFKAVLASFEASYLSTILSSYTIKKSPVEKNIANPTTSLTFEVEIPSYTVKYQWYESNDGTTNNGNIIIPTPENGADTKTLNIIYSTPGIHFYYCSAKIIINNSYTENCSIELELVKSNIITVAYTGLPTVYITTPNNAEITSKENWLKKANISITGSEESNWNCSEISTSIRGRGNTTWGQPKKPYALKLDKKQSILGMPAHKRWVLIANYLDNSFIRNEMAFYLSDLFELDYTVHGKFVDLILNGEYKGLYWLGEAIKPDENRVNINDGSKNMPDNEDKDYLIEMDSYYDEPVKFRSSIRNLPYMIKNDDYMVDDDGNITTGGQVRLERLQTKITNLENLLYPDFSEGMNTNACSAPDEAYTQIIDIDSWAKFWFVNELMNNGELGHPKSCYFTFDSTNNIFKAGPVWDFDWAVITNSTSCITKNTIYYNSLFKSSSFNNRVIELWTEYYNDIDINTKVESLRNELEIAAKADSLIWDVNHNPTNISLNNFDEHVDYVKRLLNRKLEIVNSEIQSMSE